MALPDSRRKSYVLSVQPIEYSLTAGTNIPAPEYSPPPSPGVKLARPQLSRPPTQGGGPLSAHPVDESMPPPTVPGAFFPPSPEPERASNNTMSSESNRNTTNSSVRPPTSPASMNHMQSAPRERRPSSVRRLFSMNSLRQSFSSSRTSLSVPRSSYGNHNDMHRAETPNAPSVMSTTASTMNTSPMHSSRNGNKLQKKRNSTWFKRKSGLFSFDENGMLDVVDEDRENKRFKPQNLPMLPEISNLGGGDLNEGSLGWDEQLFKS